MIIIPNYFKYKVGDKILIRWTADRYEEVEVKGLTRKSKGFFKKRLVNCYLYQFGFNFYLIEEDEILNLERN